MSKKPNKHYTKPEAEEPLKHIGLRKAARIMTAIAGVLGLIVAVFSLANSLWVPAAVFVALALVAFYITYAETMELRAATQQ